MSGGAAPAATPPLVQRSPRRTRRRSCAPLRRCGVRPRTGRRATLAVDEARAARPWRSPERPPRGGRQRQTPAASTVPPPPEASVFHPSEAGRAATGGRGRGRRRGRRAWSPRLSWPRPAAAGWLGARRDGATQPPRRRRGGFRVGARAGSARRAPTRDRGGYLESPCVAAAAAAGHERGKHGARCAPHGRPRELTRIKYSIVRGAPRTCTIQGADLGSHICLP